jgi:gluconolactonase
MKENFAGTVAILLLAMWSGTAYAQSPAGIRDVVAAGVQPVLVSDQFLNTEAPLGAPDGSVYFSDTAANRTYHIDTGGQLWIERERTDRGNGLALTRQGEMVWAEGDLPGITVRNPAGGYLNLLAGFGLLEPNDLIIDSRGGIYFTDHNPRPVVPGLKVFVYYLAPGTHRPIVIDDKIGRPNGIALGPDEKVLFVDNTIGNDVYRFDIRSDGAAGNKRVFAKLRDIAPDAESMADGMAVDRDGRVYVATITGIQVFAATGDYLGTIGVPRQPSNMAFAGPQKRTLYISARRALYRLDMLGQGPARPGK